MISGFRPFRLSLFLAICFSGVVAVANADPRLIPLFVKQWSPTSETLTISAAAPATVSDVLRNEVPALLAVTDRARIPLKPGADVSIRLDLGDVPLPALRSRYRDRIVADAYRLVVAPDGIRIQSSTPAGAFYGIQTLGQLLSVHGSTLPCGEIVDWPDLPVRMIMVDPARQNENFTYYKRVIDFCARWKINAILCHLTDDETSCLYQPDYPELMHPQAWRPEEIRDLVDYAQARHIELIPEIESLGHSRMFLRRPDSRDILHKTKGERTVSWMGTDVPGFTNVLCPASDKTYEYLDRMYAAAARSFPNELLHIGCDEVDMTACERCEAKFGDISKAEWFRGHLLRCREIAARHGRKIALWGDMLLKDPDILEEFPREGVVIYDWHYLPDVAPDSVDFFLDRGFEVTACPALVCSPHMIHPDAHNYENIRRFSAIARDKDVVGVNTTIWLPQRYMSDVLWPGIGFAGAHAWGGSSLKDDPFMPLDLVFRDEFGGKDGPAFEAAWKDLSDIIWHRSEFLTSCWVDEASLADAKKLLAERGEEIRADRARVRAVLSTLTRLGREVRRNREAWNTLQRSAAVLDYTLEHLQAAPEVQTDKGWNLDRIRALDEGCRRALGWIEEDWDRNRYADDPNKDGRFQPIQHLFHRFSQMHAFHTSLLNANGKEAPAP